MADQVERFDVKGLYGGVLRQMSRGRWVHYSDYEKLERELETFRRDEVAEDFNMAWGEMEDRLKEAEAERDQARKLERERVREALKGKEHDWLKDQPMEPWIRARDVAAALEDSDA